MLNDRLYKIEMGIEKLITFTKKQCDKRYRFRPADLYDYPFDVKLNNDDYKSDVNTYTHCCMVNIDGDDSKFLNIIKDNLEEIISILPTWIKPEFLDQVVKATRQNADLENQTYKTIMCEDVDIRQHGFEDVMDYIISQFVRTKFKDVVHVITGYYSPVIFLRNMKDTDHVVKTLIQFFKKFKLRQDHELLTLTAMTPEWINFYILVHGECGKGTIQYINNKNCISTWIGYLSRLHQNDIKSKDDLIQGIIDDHEEFRNVISILRSIK